VSGAGVDFLHRPHGRAICAPRQVAELDVTRITLHGLRHSWASLALQAGVHPKVVSERLGHATVSFTLDTYSHVMPGMQEDAAARVASLVLDG
jgi:integrase